MHKLESLGVVDIVSTMPAFLQNYGEAQQMYLQMVKALSAAVQTTHGDGRWLAAFNDSVLVCFLSFLSRALVAIFLLDMEATQVERLWGRMPKKSQALFSISPRSRTSNPSQGMVFDASELPCRRAYS